MANKAGKTDEAQQFFRKSLKEKVSDQQLRGLTYYEIGKGYLDKNDYIGAGIYYDSALAVMTYQPSKILLQDQSSYIKKISKNYYLIKKNDSIISLAKMSPEQKTDFSPSILLRSRQKKRKKNWKEDVQKEIKALKREIIVLLLYSPTVPILLRILELPPKVFIFRIQVL